MGRQSVPIANALCEVWGQVQHHTILYFEVLAQLVPTSELAFASTWDLVSRSVVHCYSLMTLGQGRLC